MRSKKNILITLCCYLAVFVLIVRGIPLTDVPIPDGLVDSMTDIIENHVNKTGATCENYNEICDDQDNRDFNFSDDFAVCKLVMRLYLCDNLQDRSGVVQIIRQMLELLSGHGVLRTIDELTDNTNEEIELNRD